MSRAPWALALALAAALVWGCHERSERLRQEGAYGILAAEADSLAVVAREKDALAEAARVAEAAVRLSAQVQQDSAVARAVRAASRRPAIVDRVVLEAGPDSAVVRAAVEEVVDSVVATEVVPLRAALAQAELRIASWEREAAAKDRALEACLCALEARERAEEAKPDGRWLGMDAPTAALVSSAATATTIAAAIAWAVFR